MKMKNVPNILSSIRILLVGVFVWVFFTDYPNNIVYALLVFLLAGITDVVDGHIARKYNCISSVGKVLDPLADKMMQCAAMICLMIKNLIPVWFGIPFILKEVVLLIGGLFLYTSNKVLAVSKWYGKFAVTFFYLTIFSAIVFHGFFAQNPIYLNLLCGVALLITIGALVSYFVSYVVVGRDEKADKTVEQKDALN